MKIYTFEAWHADSIDLQPEQSLYNGYFNSEQLEQAGDAITVVHDGTILFCGGRKREGSRWVLWALLSKHAGPHMLAITRVVKRALAMTAGDKIAWIDPNFANAKRWARIVGLEFTTVEDAPMVPGSHRQFHQYRSIEQVTARALDLAKVNGQVECPLEHHFSEGLYARKLTIPKGTLVVGKVHRHRTLNICARGKIAILTPTGPRIFKAGDVVVTEPGLQKVGYALEETDWINVHATEETDLALIEAHFVEDPRVPVDAVSFLRELEAA